MQHTDTFAKPLRLMFIWWESLCHCLWLWHLSLLEDLPHWLMYLRVTCWNCAKFNQGNRVCTWRRWSAWQQRAYYKPSLHCQWRWKNDRLSMTIHSGCLWVSYSLTRFLLDSWMTGKPFMCEAGELLWVGVVVPCAPRLCADVNVNTVLVKSPLAVQLGSCTGT